MLVRSLARHKISLLILLFALFFRFGFVWCCCYCYCCLSICDHHVAHTNLLAYDICFACQQTYKIHYKTRQSLARNRAPLCMCAKESAWPNARRTAVIPYNIFIVSFFFFLKFTRIMPFFHISAIFHLYVLPFTLYVWNFLFIYCRKKEANKTVKLNTYDYIFSNIGLFVFILSERARRQQQKL